MNIENEILDYVETLRHTGASTVTRRSIQDFLKYRAYKEDVTFNEHTDLPTGTMKSVARQVGGAYDNRVGKSGVARITIFEELS